MTIQALGYLGIGTDKLDDWTRFATDWLGMQAVDRGGGMRAFRMDNRSQRLVIDRTLAEGEVFFVWKWRTPLGSMPWVHDSNPFVLRSDARPPGWLINVW